MAFLKEILSTSSETSHKRLIAIISLICLMAICVINALGKTVQTELIYCFAALCGGNSVLTVIEKIKK